MEKIMKKKILLLYPEFPTTYWSLKYALPFINKKGMIPPLGLMTIASMIPDRYSVKLIDLNVRKLTDKDVQEADIVFISAMIVQKHSFDEAVRICIRYEKKIVAGGPYPTSSHELIEGVDHFILGEAEEVLPQFFSDYEKGSAKKIYDSPNKPDITKTLPPRFDLINVRDYNNMALQYSRGCPFNCEFCDIIEMFGRTPRTKDPDQFVDEIELVYATGFKGSVFIVDDNFIGHKQKVKVLLKKIIEWQEKRGYPYTFFTEASIDMSRDDELLKLMEKAGFDMVFIGIETPDKETLKHTDKNQNVNIDLIEGIKKIQRHGIEVSAGFIVGFDSDSEDIFERQISFIQKSGIPIAMVGLLIALPNTRLFRRLKDENRIVTHTTGNNTHELDINFIPVMPVKSLVNGYKEILSKIYSPKNYFRRCETLIKKMPKGNRVFRFPGITGLRALVLSLVRQGFSTYGYHYFTFLLKIIIQRPSRFIGAVTLSVKGFHFFKITKEIMIYDDFIQYMKQASESIQARIKFIPDSPGKEVVQDLKKYIEKHISGIERKYRRLSRDIQKYQNAKIVEFREYCNELVYDYSKKFMEPGKIIT